ncbi:alpha/beta hydrolase [Frateuria sp. GZRR35]|uniref:alpha/beta hydrolase n=1 Tax=unclassified Frateuria TaxID=2648894 RepID=UPI003EDCACF0
MFKRMRSCGRYAGLAAAWLACGAALAGTPNPPPATPRQAAAPAMRLLGQVLEIKIHGTSLEGNRLGDSPERTVSVYLPPGYLHDRSRRYPVIYSLGGYQPSPALAAQIGPHPEGYLFAGVDRAIAEGRLGKLILVNVEGWNRLGGSFWVNSASTGRWEDFVTRDVIPTIDKQFRTVRDRDSRGLYGGSMGGFGALSIAMHRPRLFGTVFAQSPCCMAMVEELGPTPAWVAMQQVTLAQADAAYRHGEAAALQTLALAAAFAPDARRPDFFGDLPYRVDGGRVVPAEPAYATWLAHLPGNRLDREAAGLKTLNGLRIQYGDHDELRHIPASVPVFHRALLAHGVRHEYLVDHGGHVDLERFGRDAVPFFARTLAGAGAGAVASSP